MPEPGQIVATITPGAGMPIDAFALAAEGLTSMKAAETTPADPDDYDDMGEQIPERKLLIANNEKGGYTLYAADDVKLRSLFAHGHFEIRWVDE